jgi:DNA transposition AAA+ family ATPase
MADAKKLTEEEYTLLISLQNRWNELTKRFGELHYQKKGIDAEITLTDQALDDLDSERFEVVKRLQDTYGVGQVNLATGEFIPDAPLTS